MGSDRVEAAKMGSKSAKPAQKERSPFGGTVRRGSGPRLANVEGLGPLVDAIVSQGDAVMFAKTSDGGALCITLLRDKARDKGYSASQDELQAQVDWLKEEYLGG